MKPVNIRPQWQLSFDWIASLRELVILAIIMAGIAVPSIAWADFAYPNFNSVAGLSMEGAAGQSGAALRLTPDLGDQSGAAWRTAAKAHLAAGFDTTFVFQMTGTGGGADGMAFVIQDDASNALGQGGGGLGYHDIPRSLAVELDTFGFSPETGNHISVQTLGTFPNNATDIGSIGQVNPFTDLNDGQPHTLTVRYRPGFLLVFLDANPAPVLNVSVDLQSIFNESILDGSGDAWVGFTAATGGAFQAHDVISWTFDETSDPLPQGACCTAGGCVMSNARLCGDAIGGHYAGDATACETADCSGACCTSTGCSWFVSIAFCATESGTFMGVGSTCPTVDCNGACCLPNGTCEISDQTNCEINSGVFHGSGTSCWPFPCLLPQYGACCVDGDCDDQINEADCATNNGTWYGRGTTCPDIDFCNTTPAFGACCQGDSCVMTAAEACVHFNGTFGGIGSDCLFTNCSSNTPCNCLAATPITGVTFADGSTTGQPECQGPTCLSAASSARIYAYTASDTGLGLVNTYNGITNFDTVLSIHSGCPMTAANELACNEDSGNLGAQLQFCAEAGQTYYIRVGGVNGATGDFTLLALVFGIGVSEGPFQNPANGHWYYLLNGGPWAGAEQFAQTKGGHLVTINDDAENTWVNSTFNTSGLFIGLNDVANEGTFVWTSGQPVTYTNWEIGEPSNGGGAEDYAVLTLNGKWLDQDQCSGTSGLQSVVEVDTVTLPGLLAGPIVNPANCHTYYFTQPGTWIEAQMKAQSLGGNLVTINDAAENEYVRSHFANFGGTPQPVWIGLTDRATEGTFAWLDGSPVTYTNWNPGEPNDLSNEDYVAMNEPATGGWNDAHSGEALSAVIEVTTAPCKGDMNCNGTVTVADMPLFIQALLGTPGFPGCDVTRADVNNDGLNNGRDVKPFVALLTAP